MSRLDQTIKDFSKNLKKIKFYISEKTLFECLKFLQLSRKLLFGRFCAEINDLFDNSEILRTIPFVVRYKLAVESPIDIFISKNEISILKNISIFDESMNPFRCSKNDFKIYYSFGDLIGGIKNVISNYSVKMILQVCP